MIKWTSGFFYFRATKYEFETSFYLFNPIMPIVQNMAIHTLIKILQQFWRHYGL